MAIQDQTTTATATTDETQGISAETGLILWDSANHVHYDTRTRDRIVQVSCERMGEYDREWSTLQAHLRAYSTGEVFSVLLRRLRTEKLWTGGEESRGQPVADNQDRLELTGSELATLTLVVRQFERDLRAAVVATSSADASTDDIPF